MLMIINGIEFAEECMICHQKEIENEDEDKMEKEKEFELNDIKDLEGKENEVKRKVIRHKNDRFKSAYGRSIRQYSRSKRNRRKDCYKLNI